MEVFLVIIFLIYFILIISLIIGWNMALRQHAISSSIESVVPNFISIIVAARNEEASINFLLTDLSVQQHENFEVIVVDDQSEDKTLAISSLHCQTDKRFKVISSNNIGKKHALTTGIASAKGSIIVTIDADCRVGDKWLVCIDQYFKSDKVKMIFGGVRMTTNGSMFSSLQALEFCSLIGTGAATLGLGFPTMCNGANLAFRKSVFLEVGGYASNIYIPSGDDEFLMRNIVALYPKGIHFISSYEAVVATTSQQNLSDFIYQRIRWAGKWKYHHDSVSKMMAVFIFIFQLGVLSLLPLMLLDILNISVMIALWSIKLILEYAFLRKVSVFLSVQWHWPSFILCQFLYPFYAIFIGFVSHFQAFNWKGRRLKSIKTKLDTIPDID